MSRDINIVQPFFTTPDIRFLTSVVLIRITTLGPKLDRLAFTYLQFDAVKAITKL